MAPTIPQDSVVYIEPYTKTSPQRWDIIAFNWPVKTNSIFVMRIIGLENETILMRENKLFINGQKLNEHMGMSNITYSVDSSQRFAYKSPFVVKSGHYFVLGDNSAIANDSRFWGDLNKSCILGKVIKIGRISKTGLSPQEKEFRALIKKEEEARHRCHPLTNDICRVRSDAATSTNRPSAH
jgi:signal peptidase I